ncbi:hypothetical protein E3P77_02952 [Wallemia ichthyophaga]|uniref:Mitochondrial escape protein 2 n=1 Tax=Wallemia ichthyophaga TaxID=245174 RepID=A0A4T0H6F6_WALIC|nr:hypothetical protein E3P95_02752 [Wallemia ichthyophaga]TIB10940.1 hypothetical protein E3P90_02665 [Wallemia ichthyophaga]TIB11158.1 hypothetical protein E3P93_02673 [Wallemia ichthyophaga]TIB21446.1 hypothetical protein E3P89_02649 [Wallemia ichthyophaga]TIB23142.1 hypothetical protein E3P88_02684 [Wallemia ichthyophaga]
MKFALIALAAAASAVPLNRRQDSHVTTSNLDKLRDENNSLPESGVYRLDIVPGRKEGESSIELVPDENGSIIFQNNEYGRFDPRYAYSLLREHSLIDYLRTRLNDNGIRVHSIESRLREGGAFVTVSEDNSLSTKSIRNQLIDNGNLRKTTLLNTNVFPVIGSPFNEDMDRYPSAQLRVDYNGPQISQEELYNIFRRYGRIMEIESSSGGFDLTYQSTSASTAARSCVHGFVTDSGTKLKLTYQPRVSKHFYKDWIMSHPRIVVPLLVFLIGAVSYVIFDPVREYAIKSKVMRTFSLDAVKKKWLVFGDNSVKSSSDGVVASDIQERREAFESVNIWLNESPSTFITLTGARGSGKSSLLKNLMRDRQVLSIDCAQVCRAENDAQLVTELADQTGYWPIFGFLSSVSNLLDLASVGLIGTKAGFATPLEDQLKQILSITTKAVEKARDSKFSASKSQHDDLKLGLKQAAEEEVRKNSNSFSHDGRIDCIAGNGIMSELGVGIETDDIDDQVLSLTLNRLEGLNKNNYDEEKEKIKSIPVVIVKNFDFKGADRDVLFDVLSTWASNLVLAKVAHVVFVSDNVSSNKRLAKALPNKPLNSISLSDADMHNSVKFVMNRLRNLTLSSDDKKLIELIGGRVEDLEDLVRKVRSGLSIQEAINQIVVTSASELRQNILAKNEHGWKPEEAWSIIKELSKEEKVSYASTLINWPFTGNEGSLQALEQHDLITIVHKNGRPADIVSGKPIYRTAFKQLVNDLPYKALLDVTSNKLKREYKEGQIRKWETELLDLKNIGLDDGKFFTSFRSPSATQLRAEYLLKQIYAAQSTVNKIEKESDKLKKVM